MIDPVVQALMDQAKKNSSFEQSTHLAFQALSAQAETLRQQIASATAGSLTDAEKAQISATTSDLANSIATLQTDVSANTPAAAPASSGAAATDPNAPATAPAAGAADPNAPAAATDPNAPAAGAAPTT